MNLQFGTKKRRSGGGLVLLFLVLLLLGVAGAGAVVTTRVGGVPEVTLEAGLPAIGKRTPVTVTASELERGLSSLKVELIQGELVKELYAQDFVTAAAWALWAPRSEPVTVHLEVGKEKVPELKAGEATVRVTAGRAGTWLRAPEPRIETLTLPVRLTPPSLEVLSSQTYVAQGGAEVVVYNVGETAVEHGVRAGAWFFPGFPLPGGAPRQHFALFAVPYDMDDARTVHLEARDEVGNQSEVSFIDKFTPRPFKVDTLNITDDFMKVVVPKILAKVPEFQDRGSLLDNYVAINSQLRKENGDKLIALAKDSPREFLWNKPFVEMRSKVVSSFADRRTYVYKGKEIDKQDHLGFDLASVQKAPIPSANDGVVVLAEYLGIYGNCVVIDHGYGLMSLYGHLSSMDVKEGERVGRAQIIGRTGATGLALGDHLHFTMMLQGLPVTPIEWWDGHWIKDRLVRKLGEALPFSER